jgi:hypothetical protein
MGLKEINSNQTMNITNGFNVLPVKCISRHRKYRLSINVTA